MGMATGAPPIHSRRLTGWRRGPRARRGRRFATILRCDAAAFRAVYKCMSALSPLGWPDQRFCRRIRDTTSIAHVPASALLESAQNPQQTCLEPWYNAFACSHPLSLSGQLPSKTPKHSRSVSTNCHILVTLFVLDNTYPCAVWLRWHRASLHS